MANSALVTPSIITWARQRIEAPIEDIAKSTGVDVGKLQSWENGTSVPTINQAKKLAKKLRIPFVYFYLSEPPQTCKLPKNKDYRTFANVKNYENSIELRYLSIDIMQRRDVMLELYAEMDIPVIPFEQYIDIQQTDNNSIAEMIRTLLGLTYEKQKAFKNSNESLNYYLEAFAKIGILVFQSDKVSKAEMRGMSVYETIFPIIVVNRKDEPNARVFTLIHELVHLLTRTPGICDMLRIDGKTDFEIELRCNQIAAETLAPKRLLKADNYYSNLKQYGWDDDTIRRIANNFSVSREVIIGRLVSLNDINIDFYNQKLNQYTNEYEEYVKRTKKIDGFLPPSTNICSQTGKLYARTVINAYNQELITPREVSQFFSGLRIQHFDKVERWCMS